MKPEKKLQLAARGFFHANCEDETMKKAESYYINALFEWAFQSFDVYEDRDIFEKGYSNIYSQILKICEENGFPVDDFLREVIYSFYENLQSIGEREAGARI